MSARRPTGGNSVAPLRRVEPWKTALLDCLPDRLVTFVDGGDVILVQGKWQQAARPHFHDRRLHEPGNRLKLKEALARTVRAPELG